jgi:hypothetical protein
LDYPIAGGMKIKATATAVDGTELLVAVQSINEKAAQVYGTEDIRYSKRTSYPSSTLAYSIDSSWLTSDGYTIPQNAKYLFITIKKSNNSNLSPAEIKSVVIEEV